MGTSNNNLEPKAIREFQDLNFYVDEYQRGYKWTAQQVLDFLEDINSFDEKNVFYCLQPLAVKTKKWKYNGVEIEGFEVIDGQQRLTTIFMIFKVLCKKLYSIHYQTRPNSADFLNDIDKNIDGDFNIDFKDDVPYLSESLNEKWKDFVDADDNKKYDNIDIYHFFCAFVLIKSWFVKNEEDKYQFEEKLREYTRFIWFEDKSNDKSEIVFRNLNSGKIPLTNAELIKALFINKLNNSNKEVKDLQQNNFAREWDQIEQALNDNSFWFFINNDTNKDSYQTRIDFLFEIIVGKAHKERRDILYTYRQYASARQDLDWGNVKRLYLKLREWYDDRRTYHIIGYIIDRKFSSIDKLVKKSNQSESKTGFENSLVEIIRDNLKLRLKWENEEDKSLESINYEEDGKLIKHILLLFNIEQYQNSNSGFRFPFDEFKNINWSIEHIHAQNSDDFSTIDEVNAWLTESERIIADFQGKKSGSKIFSLDNSELRKELNSIIQEKNSSIPDTIKDLLTKTIDLTSEILGIHKLSNLALLDGSTNSGLGKKPFPEKREYVIEIDKKTATKEEEFIPLATKNVFLKYFTKVVKQYEFWGYQDRLDYMDAVKGSLNKYLVKATVGNESDG